LKAQTNPAMALIRPLKVQYFDRVSKSKKTSMIDPVRKALREQGVFFVQHPHQSVFAYITFTLPVNGIAEFHIVS